MAVLPIFLKIWFFKNSVEIFLPQGDFPMTPKKNFLWSFLNHLWSSGGRCHKMNHDPSHVAVPSIFSRYGPSEDFPPPRWFSNNSLHWRLLWQREILPNPEKKLNFWISRICCHPIEMDIARVAVSCKWLYHSWLSRCISLFF